MVVGWPAYGTHDRALVHRTNDKIYRKLESNSKFGIKRYSFALDSSYILLLSFLRDGYHTEIENKHERYYHEHDTHKFEKFECHWPMFYLYKSITASLANDKKRAWHYFEKCNELTAPNKEGVLVVPECYFIPEELFDAEREDELSQQRYAFSTIEHGHFLWAQALYLVAELFGAS